MARAFASALTGPDRPGRGLLAAHSRMPPGTPAGVRQRLAAAFGALPATAAGRTVTVQAQDTQAWAVAQWAVANAKALSITEVRVDGQPGRGVSHDGWQAADVPAGQVSITVADRAGGSPSRRGRDQTSRSTTGWT